MSLAEKAPSEIGSFSSPRGYTVLPASRFSDSDNSINIPVRQVANRVLAAAEFDDLSPLQQHQDLSIPYYLAPSRRVASEIAPWSVSHIAMVCVRTMSIELLFHHYSKPRHLFFPHHAHGRAPPTGTWASGLVSRRNMEALYARSLGQHCNSREPDLVFPNWVVS